MNLLSIVHALIDSFTGPEKRHFKPFINAFISSHDGGAAYAKVYHFLAKHPKATMADLKNEFENDPLLAQPSVYLTHLIDKILAYLVGPPVGSPTPAHEKMHARLLADRGIYKLALKKLHHCLAVAHRTHQHSEWIELWLMKLNILDTTGRWDEYGKWMNQVATLRSQKGQQIVAQNALSEQALQLIEELRNHYSLHAAFKPDIIARMAKIIEAISSPATLSEQNKLYYHKLGYRIALARWDDPNAATHLKAVYEIYQRDNALCQHHPAETVGVYFSFSRILFDQGQHKKGLAILDSLALLFPKPPKPLRALIFNRQRHGQLFSGIRSIGLKFSTTFWQQLAADFEKHQPHLPDADWTRFHLFAGLAAWLQGDSRTALGWLNRVHDFKQGAKWPEALTMIKTLLAFIHFQQGNSSLAHSKAIAAMNFAATRNIDIGPFLHLLNFVKNQDPVLIKEGHDKDKLKVMEKKFKQAAENWQSTILDVDHGLFFIQCLSNY
jgi:tetratricopeptide (TPR) repeat protein